MYRCVGRFKFGRGPVGFAVDRIDTWIVGQAYAWIGLIVRLVIGQVVSVEHSRWIAGNVFESAFGGLIGTLVFWLATSPTLPPNCPVLFGKAGFKSEFGWSGN